MSRKISPGAQKILESDRQIEFDPNFGVVERERPTRHVRNSAEVFIGSLAWGVVAALIVGGALALFESFAKHPIGDGYTSKEGIAVVFGAIRLAYGLIKN